jgi:hypothetical protein
MKRRSIYRIRSRRPIDREWRKTCWYQHERWARVRAARLAAAGYVVAVDCAELGDFVAVDWWR